MHDFQTPFQLSTVNGSRILTPSAYSSTTGLFGIGTRRKGLNRFRMGLLKENKRNRSK